MTLEIVRYKSLWSLETYLKSQRPIWGRTVYIVPNSGDREELKKILLKDGSFGKENFSIIRWDGLYRELGAFLESELLTQIDPPDNWLALRGLVEELRVEYEDKLPPGSAQRSFIKTLGETIRELIREEVKPSDIEKLLEKEDPKDPVWILSKLYGEYEKLLKSKGLLDSAGICSSIRDLALGNPRAMEWFRSRRWVMPGFYSFTHSQLAMVRMMARSGASVTLLCPRASIKNEYGAPEQLFKEAWEIKDLPSDQIDLFTIQSGTKRQEIEAVVRELVLWEKGFGDMAGLGHFPGWGKTGLFVEKESLALAEETLKRYKVPYDRQEGPAVAETPLWETVKKSFEWMEGGFRPDDSRELADFPWIGGSLEGVKDFLSSLSKGKSPEDLLKAMKDLASSGKGWARTLSSFLWERPDLDSSVREISLALEEIDRKLSMENPFKTPLKGPEAMAFLKAWAEKAVLWQGFGRQNTLALFSNIPPVLTSRDLWVITGALFENWPGKMEESPLLLDEKKEILHGSSLFSGKLDHTHLPLLSEKRLRKEVLFRRLLASGKKVLASWPTLDQRGHSLKKTPFLDSALEDGWVRLSGNLKTSPDRVFQEDQVVLSPAEIKEDREEAFFWKSRELPGPLPKEGLKGDFSVALSSIDDYEACPFMFRSRHIWGLEEPFKRGFSPSLAGNALHLLWKKVWDSYMADQAKTLVFFLEKFMEEAVKSSYESLWDEEKLKRHKEIFIRNALQSAMVLDKAESRGLKDLREKCLTEYDLPKVKIQRTQFSGRADRIDILKDGRVLIWDYKSGRSDSYANSLQLGSYGVLFKKNPSGLGDPAFLPNFFFICHRDQKLKGSSDQDIWDMLEAPGKRTSQDKTMEKAEKTMERLAYAMDQGDFPPNYMGSRCRNCPYSALCRRGEIERPEEREGDEDAYDGE